MKAIRMMKRQFDLRHSLGRAIVSLLVLAGTPVVTARPVVAMGFHRGDLPVPGVADRAPDAPERPAPEQGAPRSAAREG